MDKLLALDRQAGPESGPAPPDLESLLPVRRLRITAAALGLIVIYTVARIGPGLSEPRMIATWVAAIVFAATFVLTTFRPLSVAVLLCGISGAVMQIAVPAGTGFIIAIVAVTQATRLRGEAGKVIAGLSGGAYLAALAVTTHHVQTSTLLAPGSGLAFAYIAAASFQRLRQEKRHLFEEKQKTEALLQEVLAGRDAQIRAAALDERSRLAREIHDILAHTLSALSVQLEGARLLIEQRPDDPATVAAVDRASHLARAGLDETRRAVGALRGDTLPGPEALPQLAAEFEQDSGIPCRLSIEGQPVVLMPEARLALYRTAQEALTNIRKHSDASSVDISLRYTRGGADLTIENAGTTRPSSILGSGYGLLGLRERAELARGTLAAGAIDGGYQVHLWLPA